MPRTRAQERQRSMLEAGLIILLVRSMLEAGLPWGDPFTVNAYELAKELHTTHKTLMLTMARLSRRGQLVYDATPSQGTTVWLPAALREWAEVLLGWDGPEEPPELVGLA